MLYFRAGQAALARRLFGLYNTPYGSSWNWRMTIQVNVPIDTDYRSRVARARAGVHVKEAVRIMDAWSIPVALFATILGSSVRKWSRLRAGPPNVALGPVESDRLLRLCDVLEHAKNVFDNDKDARTWFLLSNAALSGDTPLSLMDTDAGVHQVDDVLTRLEFGVYS